MGRVRGWSCGVLVGVVLAGCAESCPYPTPVALLAHLAVPQYELIDATVTMCRNAACSTGTLPSGGVATLEGAFEGRAFILQQDPSGAWELMVEPVRDLDLQDGDTYHLTVVRAGGPALFDRAKTVASYPPRAHCSEGVVSAFDLDLGSQ